MNTKTKRLSAFNYFGGKSRYLDWFLPLLDVPAEHYIEPFCGSCAVFLNKKPHPIETINDLDKRVINFFRVLREKPKQLIALLELTPYSRSEFQFSERTVKDPVEDARRFFVRAMQSFGASSGGTRRRNSFRIRFTESRNGVSSDVSKWQNKIKGLPEIIGRIGMAQIDNRPALEIIEKFSTSNSIIYCDPPYPEESRTGVNDYTHDFTNDHHRELAALLNKIPGKVAISGYQCELMDELYPPPLWRKHAAPLRKTNLGKKEAKLEVLWTNYNPLEKTPTLFDQ